MTDEVKRSSGERLHTPRQLSIRERIPLRAAVEKVETLTDPQRRTSVVKELRRELGDRFKPASPVAAWDVVEACLEIGEIRVLLLALELLGTDEKQQANLTAVVDKLLPETVFDALDQRRLADALSTVEPEIVKYSLISIAGAGYVDTHTTATDFIVALHSAGDQPDRDRVVLSFLEAVAHRADESVYLSLHLIVHDAASGAGLPDLAKDLCAQTSTYIKTYGVTGAPPDPARSDTEPDDIVQVDANVSGDDVITIATTTVITSLPAVYGGVPAQNAHFVGRAGVLEEMRRTLRNNVRAAVLPHTLHGLGGVGKSQVAVEYAYRYKGDYDLVWWIPSDDERSIRRSLASLALRLNLTESTDVQQQIDAVHDELRIARRFPRWLLVFDNAGEPEVVRRYLPRGNGHVLITSRSNTWKNQSAVVEVDVFSEQECVDYLTSRWEGLSEADALNLADKLGRLPLALDQVSSVHQQTGMQLPTILGLLDSNPARMLAEPPTDYPVSVAMSWRLAFTQLKENNPAAAQLLQMCAFLSSLPIYVPLLRQGRGANLPAPLSDLLRDEYEFRNAVRDIGKFALAQLDVKRDFLTIHLLVRVVLRDGLSEEEREPIEHAAHEVLALANPGSPDRNDTWTLHGHIAPHVIPSGVIHSPDSHVRQIVLDQIRYYFAIGDYEESRRLASIAVDNWRGRLGPDDPMTLMASFNLANALRVLGSYNEARNVTDDTAQRMYRTLGREHGYSLRVANSVNYDLRLAGRFAEALAMDTEVLSLHRQVLGDGDPATMRAAHNLAIDLRLTGDFDAAFTLDEETYKSRRTVLGEDNPETLASINALARDIYGQGRYRQALQMQQARLAAFERRLNPGNRFVLVARRNLAVLLRKVGEHAAALDEAESNLKATRDEVGDTHEFTLAASVTLANTLRVVGEIERALATFETALDGYRTRFGHTHPFTLACGVNLAIALRQTPSRGAAALTLNSELLPVLTETLGDSHPYTLCCSASLASDFALAGRLTDARAMSEEVVNRSKITRTTNHPYTLACQANLALDLNAVGQHQDGALLKSETETMLRQQLGPEHPETVAVERGKRAETDIEVPNL
ncbi:FxSxx-COOH system tetratricopeptide repeat protein [Catellatospora sichuanensis]|uniref:FxSxx-COOH system tetratricopeptide repeat protein n=1 Tax=Catellatospora sichuanensis TaxID=1969805 RepID=UPI00118270A1|nr:FxSxx-COOH system tetratricopeptide repeat protein [Catellatospora sichuanensis]